MNSTITISAPGKVILHGEHAVVYGKRALAGSLGLRTVITLKSGSESFVTISLPVISVHQRWSCNELQGIIHKPLSEDEVRQHNEINDSTLEGIKSFTQLSCNGESDTKDLAIIAFLYLFTSIAVKNNSVVPSLDIEILSHLPTSAGLGSSAAYSTCLAAALLVHRGMLPPRDWSPDHLKLINSWAFIAEKIIHGRPSGIDNAVSTFGGALFFQAGVITPLVRMPGINILLINTKVSRSTKALVEKVRQKHDQVFPSISCHLLKEGRLPWISRQIYNFLAIRKKDRAYIRTYLKSIDKHMYPEVVKPVLDSIEAITMYCQETLEKLSNSSDDSSTCYRILQDLIEMNQNHLRLLGVSHSSIEQVCHITERHGLSAKLTGAGGGGCVFTIIPPNFKHKIVEQVMEELVKSGFDCFQTTLGGPGVQPEVAPSNQL